MTLNKKALFLHSRYQIFKIQYLARSLGLILNLIPSKIKLILITKGSDAIKAEYAIMNDTIDGAFFKSFR